MEYEPSFMELEQAAAGKPETQFGPAEAPVWPLVREQAEALFDQTRDLRVALLWARSAINTDGIEGLGVGLSLLHGLLATFWDDLHPRPEDDGDTFARVSVLASLNSVDGLMGDMRQVPILRDRRLGGLRMRDIEVAAGRLEARAGENAYTTSQVEGLIGEHPELLERIKTACAAATESLQSLRSLMNERFSSDAVEIKTLSGMLSSLKAVIPEKTSDTLSDSDGQTAAAEGSAPVKRSGGGGTLGAIESRQDAVRAIHLICAYLERFEPTSPAQLLLRRAERLIDKNFIDLVRDLAPEAVAEVARILGVKPDESTDGQDA
jgi:type VI secretion system protein ImpA